MANTTAGRMVTFTATNDGVAFPPLAGRKLIGLSFQGTGLTAAQGFKMRDTGTAGTGNIIADHAIAAANESADLWGGRTPQILAGIAVDNTTVGGTWIITATFEG